MNLKKVVKAGALANGAERGKGRVVHLVDSVHPYMELALCGAVPAIQWSIRDDAEEVTCKKCLRLQREILAVPEHL